VNEQLEAADRFPDRNPNPVLRIDRDGTLVYANASSAPVQRAIGARVGQRLAPEMHERLRAAARAGSDGGEVIDGHRTFSLLVVEDPELGFINIYGTDVTASKVVERFPNENPNPVLRISYEGRLMYANDASRPIVETLELGDQGELPADLARRLMSAADEAGGGRLELEAANRTYALNPVRIPEFGFINVYGTDITAEKVVAKFPGHNPNPVLRLNRSGRLLYANPASQRIVESLGIEIGDRIPRQLAQQVFGQLREAPEAAIEMTAAEHIYELTPVLVEGVDVVNLYGTDVTAARELAAAKEETERLLLNILPPPIADRLRSGERIIADRFDDATLLIADIVGFTALSSALSANELVDLLDSVFSECDALVERHGLEKVKTIGDAYMVIGGVPTRRSDHAQRVADFALDMTAAMEAMRRDLRAPVAFRVGISSGPVVAGVIGNKRTIYDVWGDTVNLASRMESLAVPGRIQVTSSVHDLLGDRYSFEPRGMIEVKGKGQLPTWFLTGRH